MVIDENTGKVAFSCRTLELAWKDNRSNISCVPEGCFPIVFEYSPKFDMKLWELKGVPGRSEAKIHTANYYRQLNGCIAIGDLWLDIDGDGYPDIRNSRKTLERLHSVLEPYQNETLIIEII